MCKAFNESLVSLTPRGGGTHTARASAPHGPCVGLAGCLGSPRTRLSHRRRHAPRERSELLWSRNWAPQTPMSVPVTHGPCHTHRQTPAAIPGGVVQARAVALPSLLSPALGPLRSIPGAPRPFSPHIPSLCLWFLLTGRKHNSRVQQAADSPRLFSSGLPPRPLQAGDTPVGRTLRVLGQDSWTRRSKDSSRGEGWSAWPPSAVSAPRWRPESVWRGLKLLAAGWERDRKGAMCDPRGHFFDHIPSSVTA